MFDQSSGHGQPARIVRELRATDDIEAVFVDIFLSLAPLARKFEELAVSSFKGCGLSDVLYRDRYSSGVDGLVADFSPVQRSIALRLARQYGDYATSSERQQQRDDDPNMCAHGLDPDCCPAGCGDIE